MKVVLLTAGSRGDVQPFIALAREVQRNGHDVTLAGPADARELVSGYGVPFASLGVDYQAMLKDPKMGGAVLGRPSAIVRAMREARKQMHSLLDHAWTASQGADAVVFHPKALAGSHIAETLSIPCFLAIPAPLLTPTQEFPVPIGALANLDLGPLNRATYRLGQLAALPYHGIIDRWRGNTLGLPPRSRLSSPFSVGGKPPPVLYAFSETMVPRALDWPEDVHVTGFWLLDDEMAEYEPPAAVRAFLEDGEPPVYIGFGSMTGGDSKRTTGVVLEAVGRAGGRAILSVGWGGLRPPDVPGNVLVVTSMPHQWLFPRCAAVVHHGGAGTTATGLHAGRPTVICPYFGDQLFWGQRVHSAGAGPAPIPQKRLRASELSQAIRTAVSDPLMRKRAEDLGIALRGENGARRAAQLILEAISPALRGA